MVYGFLGENAGAGLGLNSAGSAAFTGIPSPAAQQQQQPQRELFRDVLGLRGEEYSGVYRVGLRPAAAPRDDHHHHPAQEQQQIQHDPGSSFVAYAHQQQQQQRLHTLQRDHQDHEMLFRGAAILHPTAPAAGINRRLVDRRDIEDDYESEAEQGIWGGNRGNVAEASSENTHSFVNPTRRLDTIATPSKNIVEASPLIDVSRQVLARESESAAAAAAALQQQQEQQQQQHRKHQEGSTCKECGNQAKKDCQYQRCRTCCKSRAFDCQTHVRSTWVPAARRRERHGHDSIQDAGMDASEGLLPKPKRARTSFQLVGSSASLTPTSSGGSPHGSETQHSAAPSFRGPFPTEFRAQALFKCVKLTTVEDGEDEYAYQTTVKIGGHVFKGVLHDRGLENENVATSMSHLQLGAAKSVAPPASALVDPVTLYGHAGSGLLEELRDTRAAGGGNW